MTDAADLRKLYAGPPETFVERRTALAKQLRAAGQRDDAAAVAKLRRPSRAAWALNRVAADRAAELAQLVDIGRQLEAVQRGEGGGAAELRRLTGERRQLIGRLADAAETELAGDASGLREKLQGTLEAVSVDPGAAEALAAGTLDKERDPPSGFGPLGMAPPPSTAEAGAAAPAAPAAAATSDAPEAREEPEEPDRTPELQAALGEVETEKHRLDLRIAALEQELDGARRRADGLTRRRDAILEELELSASPARGDDRTGRRPSRAGRAARGGRSG